MNRAGDSLEGETMIHAAGVWEVEKPSGHRSVRDISDPHDVCLDGAIHLYCSLLYHRVFFFV